MHDAHAYFVVLVEPEERGIQCLDRALHIRLDDDVEILDIALLNLLEECVKRYTLRLDEVAALIAEASLRNRTRLFLIDGGEDVARRRNIIQTENLNRHGGSRLFHVVAAIVDHRAHMTVCRTDNDGVADAQRTALDEHGSDGAAPLVELCLDDDAACLAVRVCLQFLDLSDKQDVLKQVVDTDALFCRDGHHNRISAVFLGDESVLHELLLDAVRVCTRLVNLVDRNDDGHPCRFRVVDCLDRLRHNAVVRCDDENCHVRDLRTARTHRRERLMARRIKEDDLLALTDDLIGTDVLGDAARLMRADGSVANGIEQRGLAVIDVPHDGDDRRAILERLRVVLDLRDQRRVDIRRQFLRRHAELCRDEGCCIVVDLLIDARHDAHQHELLDDVRRRVAHLGREILDGNRLRQLDVLRTCNLCLHHGCGSGCAPLAPLACAAAAALRLPQICTLLAVTARTSARIAAAVAACGIVAPASTAASAALVAPLGLGRRRDGRCGCAWTSTATPACRTCRTAAGIACAARRAGAILRLRPRLSGCLTDNYDAGRRCPRAQHWLFLHHRRSCRSSTLCGSLWRGFLRNRLLHLSGFCRFRCGRNVARRLSRRSGSLCGTLFFLCRTLGNLRSGGFAL